MRNPIVVLKLLTEKASVKEYYFERLYRILYNPDFYLLAYKNIAASPGSMTTGADGLSIDNMSPVLANIYLSELDTFMEEYKARFDTKSPKRKANREYTKAAGRYHKAKKVLDAGNHSKEAVQELKMAQKQMLHIPRADALDAGYKRIQYNRYADDFVVGVIASKQDAQSIKKDLRQFLSDKLKLTLSEKTKVTHSSKATRYLGYDIRIVRNKTRKRDKNGVLKRPWYGKAFLYVPHEKWENKLHELRAMQVKQDKNRGRDFWRPTHRNELLNSTDIEIVRQYNSEIRGLHNFYSIAENVSVLNNFCSIMRYSMLKAYAGKYRTCASVIKRRSQMICFGPKEKGRPDPSLFYRNLPCLGRRKKLEWFQ